jgi:hypothetical protein
VNLLVSVNFPVELHERFSHDMIVLMGSFDNSYKTSEWNSFSESLAGAMGCVRDYRLCIEGAVCTVSAQIVSYRIVASAAHATHQQYASRQINLHGTIQDSYSR